jgi:alpha-L-fucosidase
MGKAPEAAHRWFREARYGMFIHYGLYSLLGRHEWALCYERIPAEEYRQLAARFNPRELCIRDWARLARANGMRYMCLTTRHHEGFALFDTQAAPEFSSVATIGRDLVAEYVEACHAEGLGVGLYYSVGNWLDEGFVRGPQADPVGWHRFVTVAQTQLCELMMQYGPIDYLFYDGCPPPETWDAEGVNAEIRRLQPNILISSRCELDEDVVSAEGYTIADPGTTWETCLTTNSSWGYNAGDPDWKTPRQIALTLLTCAHNGGNLLLNVGPDAEGALPAPAVELLNEAGAWVHRHAEAIYGTAPHPFAYADQKLSTSRGNTAYIGLHAYHGPETTVAGIGNRVDAARLLGSGEAVDFRQEGNRLLLTGLPRAMPDPLLPVVALTLDGDPVGVPNPLLNHAKYQF